MITAIILASGLSRRMARDKLSLEYKNNPLASYAIDAVRNAEVDARIIVTNNPLISELAKGFIVVPNDFADEGRSASIRVGVSAAHPDSRYIFLVADQPFVTAEVINAVITLGDKNPDRIIVCAADGRRGNPVLFPNIYRGGLSALSGDSGGRELITPECVVECAVPAKVLFDIDTAEDYELLCL